jgi:DNA-binding NarL/FixJ family response regulator
MNNHQNKAESASQIKLTGPELTLLEMLAVEGLTVKEIAARINPNKRTIEKQIENIRVRFGCINVRQLIYRVTKEGLIA